MVVAVVVRVNGGEVVVGVDCRSTFRRRDRLKTFLTGRQMNLKQLLCFVETVEERRRNEETQNDKKRFY